MPIIGLTTDLQPGSGLPQVARLYKGSEQREHPRKPGVKIMGTDLDYFRAEFEPQFEELAGLWLEMYGPEPQRFEPVFLAASTTEAAFAAWKEAWTATAMLHRCDGDYQALHYDVNSESYLKNKIPCAAPQCGCKPVGRLSLVLPDFIEASGVLGYVSIATHSINDILTVYRYLRDIEALYGTLTGIPFVFGRAERQISAPKTDRNGERNGRIKITKSLFYLHATEDFTRERLLPTLAGFLPRQDTQPEADTLATEDARNLLGSGHSRRIDTRLPDWQGAERSGREATPAETEGHWARNNGGERFAKRAEELGLTWEIISRQLEPGRILKTLSDTTLLEEAACQQLEVIAAAKQSFSKSKAGE